MARDAGDPGDPIPLSFRAQPEQTRRRSRKGLCISFLVGDASGRTMLPASVIPSDA